MRRSKLIVVCVGMALGLVLGHTIWAEEAEDKEGGSPFVLILETEPKEDFEENLLKATVTSSANMKGQKGLIRYAVLQSLDKKSTVTLVSEWEDMDSFAEWMDKGGINAGQSADEAKEVSTWTADMRATQSAVVASWEAGNK